MLTCQELKVVIKFDLTYVIRKLIYANERQY